MNILATQYTLEHKAFEIYLAGCFGAPHCTNCHNPESWDFNQGKYYAEELPNITSKVIQFGSLVDNIFILGGEPLDQNIVELKVLLKRLKVLNKTIWLFTRYEIDEVPSVIVELVDYIKCGKYLEELKVENNAHFGINLATSNQYIIKLK